MTYKISNEAQIDIEKIWLYTFNNWSLQQADRYINLILDEIEYLTQYPTSGKAYDHIREGYYRSKVYNLKNETAKFQKRNGKIQQYIKLCRF